MRGSHVKIKQLLSRAAEAHVVAATPEREHAVLRHYILRDVQVAALGAGLHPRLDGIKWEEHGRTHETAHATTYSLDEGVKGTHRPTACVLLRR